MGQNQVIAVVGATGMQGGGLVRAILADPSSGMTVRALTRDVNSDKARELARLGAEVVAADVHDGESLKRAFAGAAGVFCVTFFWSHFSPEKEFAEAEAMAKAAKSAGVPHVIWSTLEDTRRWVPLSDNRMPTLMGKYKVPHFDAKGESDRFFADAGQMDEAYDYFKNWDNLIHFGMGPKKGPDGTLAFTLPMGEARLPGIAAEDIGKCALGLLKKRDAYLGKTVGIAGEHLTGSQMAVALTKALGQEVRYNAVPPEVYRTFGFPGADDLGNMFQFKRDFNALFCGAREPAIARAPNPGPQTFAQWLEANKGRIPLS